MGVVGWLVRGIRAEQAQRERARMWVTGGGVALLVFACAKSPTATDSAVEVSAKVAQFAAAVTGQNAAIADEVSEGRHLGFDTNLYPGDETMRAWKEAPGAPYSWVGFYLPGAPCHKDATWAGKRQTLRDMGWGMAVVYVGQQAWGGRGPRSLSPSVLAGMERRGTTCSTDYLSAQRGVVEANDAIARTAAEGFTNGTVIYLDVERMENIPQAMRDYYSAWVKRVLEDGRYRPGIYAHKHNAAAIYGDVKALFTAAGVKEEPRFWIASAKDFDASKAVPTDVGHEFAGVWQGVIDVTRSVAELPLPIDINISAWPSPSD